MTTGTCELKEPSVPFATVTSVTLNLDGGTTIADPTNAAIGMYSVDGKLLSAADFAAQYTVTTAPLAS